MSGGVNQATEIGAPALRSTPCAKMGCTIRYVSLLPLTKLRAYLSVGGN